nr:ankyrin repeat-containing protein ITN1-like [Populus alba]
MIGWQVGRIQKEKDKHESALKLAQELIERNKRHWWQSINVVGPNKVTIETPGQGGRGRQSEGQKGGRNPGEGGGKGVDPGEGGGKGGQRVDPIPLFIAISNGIEEIAKEILEKFPQGVELVNETGQNIMHVAVMHRRLEIYSYVKKTFKSIMIRLSSRIDNNGYTLLHHVAHMKHYRGGTKPSPALKLQEEIQWFKRVQRAIPPSLSEKRAPREVPPDNEGMQRWKELTALDLFQEEHKDQLKLAQEWIEKTSQSCSAVAVLLATVVFAAAYTIPGGSNDLGFPIFLHNRFFLAFTVLDVIALASSLTSVVMFLSILTSPFEYENFYHNIPRKLILGFILLFFSVMTTMLAFACTLFLIIHFRKKWTTGLISFAAFFPVTVFALMQFHLYFSFLSTMKDLFKEAGEYLPRYCCPFRCQRYKR